VSTSLLLRLTYAVCLLGGAATHVAVLVSHGLSWDYGGVPMLTRVFWASLAFLDPLAALLLLVRPRIGLSLTLAIITSDVVHNTWVEWWMGLPLRMFMNWMYVSQLLFLFFVVATIGIAWRGTTSAQLERSHAV